MINRPESVRVDLFQEITKRERHILMWRSLFVCRKFKESYSLDAWNYRFDHAADSDDFGGDVFNDPPAFSSKTNR